MNFALCCEIEMKRKKKVYSSEMIASLLLAKTNSFLYSHCQFCNKRFIRLVWWHVDTIETIKCVSQIEVNQTCLNNYHVCALGN